MDPEFLEMFALHVPALELALRGGVIYLLLFALFRVVLPRQAVSFGIVGMVVLVLIADGSQNAMAGDAISLAGSAILAMSLLACHFFVRIAFLLRHRLLRRPRARRDCLSAWHGACKS